MKVRDLIETLQQADPEDNVTLAVADNDLLYDLREVLHGHLGPMLIPGAMRKPLKEEFAKLRARLGKP